LRITIVQGAFLPVPPLLGGAVEKLWFQIGLSFANFNHDVLHISRTYPGLPPVQNSHGVLYRRVRGFDMPANQILLKLYDLFYSLSVLACLRPSDIIITNTFWLPLLLRHRFSYTGRIVVSVERMPKGQMFLYKHADMIRCCSSAVSERVICQAPYLAPKVRTIPNPLPFSPSLYHFSESKDNVILYCGRLHPEKGVGLLIKAFNIACVLGLSRWSLRIVGPSDVSAGGGGQAYLRELQKLAGPNISNILFIGPVYHQETLFSEYNSASIFVYPSLAEHGEAMGLAPLEAMSFGAVPVVSSLSCFNDFIISNYNGFTFNHRSPSAANSLASILLRLVLEPQLLASLSRRALLVRQSHDANVIARQMLDAFSDLLTIP